VAPTTTTMMAATTMIMALCLTAAAAWTPASRLPLSSPSKTRRSAPFHRRGVITSNLFADIFDPGALKSQKPMPKEQQLFPALVKDEAAGYRLQEKLFSFSGEDFRVRDQSGTEIIEIDGGNINIGGWVLDKLKFKSHQTKEVLFSVERRAIATTTCYDIYREGECIAKIEREMFALTPKYKFFYEGDMNPFPDWTAEGSFSERKYTFKNGMGETIARVGRNFFEVVTDLDEYQVEVAAGVDAAAVLAVAVVIDEDHDEEDAREKKEKEEKEKEEGGGGWFG